MSSVPGNHSVKLQYDYIDLYKIICAAGRALLDAPRTSEPCWELDYNLDYEIYLDPYTVRTAWFCVYTSMLIEDLQWSSV